MEVNNLSDFPVDVGLLQKAVKTVLKREKKEEKKISVAFVKGDKIRELNKIYRGKDYITDVLSFFHGEEDFLGELVICPEKIEEKEDFTKEICRVSIHGTLHLLGYDHENEKEEKEMEEKTEKYLKKVFVDGV